MKLAAARAGVNNVKPAVRLMDLRRFYSYVRSGAVLDDVHSAPFRGPMVQLDGSDRGFELFSISLPTGSEAYA